MSRIQQYDGATISIDKGYASLHISETPEKTLNINIPETVDDKLYIGIPYIHGKQCFA